MTSKPVALILAGPNGAGKTTVSSVFVSRDVEFVNADIIGAELRSAGAVVFVGGSGDDERSGQELPNGAEARVRAEALVKCAGIGPGQDRAIGGDEELRSGSIRIGGRAAGVPATAGAPSRDVLRGHRRQPLT